MSHEADKLTQNFNSMGLIPVDFITDLAYVIT